jgi:hypothetical protein
MKVLNQVSKSVYNSLAFLENPLVRLILIAVIVIYAAGVVPALKSTVSTILNTTVAKLLMLLVILYVSARDTTLALMLTIAFLLTLQVNARNQVNDAITEGMKAANDEEMTNTVKMTEEMTNMSAGPTGANTPDSCLSEGATCTGNLSNPCTGVQAWASENNAQGLVCGEVRGFSNNDYQGAHF